MKLDCIIKVSEEEYDRHKKTKINHYEGIGKFICSNVPTDESRIWENSLYYFYSTQEAVGGWWNPNDYIWEYFAIPKKEVEDIYNNQV